MKKVLKLTLALALMMSCTSLFAQKFGRINTSELIGLMPEMKEMQTNMEAIVKDIQDNIEAIVVEYNAKLQEFQKNYASYSESVREMKAKDLNDIQARREQYEQSAQQEYQKRQQELLAPIIEKARAAIDKVAKVNGYMCVFDTSTGSLAYFDETTLTDIFPEVKKELGITATATPADAK